VGHEGYRLGQFPARWHEWNDRFRDDVRRFWRGDKGAAGALATRLAGSSDIFAPHRRPSASVNYLAAHDGFTLRDAVTYAEKNNHANGEGNRDGNAHEATWVGGDVRALLATLFVSRGIPMLTAGDEFGRSQGGNNNAYAQDNATTWLDWENADKTLIDFTANLAALRKAYPLLGCDTFLTGAPQRESRFPDVAWVGADGRPPDWNAPDLRVLGLILDHPKERLAVWINGSASDVTPQFTARDGRSWRRVFASAEGLGLPACSVSLYVEEKTQSSSVSDDTLRELAAAAGIEGDWWEVDGTHHVVTPETLRAVLAALGIAHATPDDAEGALRDLGARPSPVVARGDMPAVLGEAAPQRRRIHIAAEDGTTTALDAAPGTAPAVRLPMGCYRFWCEGEESAARHLIVSPGTCHLPEDIAGGARVFGLAAHLYALRRDGDGGIGDFESLRRFANVTAVVGGRLAGLNPLHHLFPSDRSRASPYQPSDRRFVDPIYIDIAGLLENLVLPKTRRLAARRRAAFARLETLPFVDYEAVWKAKSELLEEAYAEWPPDAELGTFVAAGGEALARHCAFETQAAGEPADPERHRYRAFLQWIADRQLARAAIHGNLYRDLAVGSAYDGGEVAGAPQLFATGVSLGAPPDPFARQGQVWNLPPASPLALAAAGFAPVRAVLAANMRHAAALRIDHILGFMRQFWVPRGAEGASGAYVRFPLDASIAVTAIESRRHRCMVVGEDLGTIPDGLREALAAADILSYRVMWFERDGLGFKPASAYPRLALACLASHDLPTFRGWRMARDIAVDRELQLIDKREAKLRNKRRAHEIALLDAATGAASRDEAAVAAHGFVAASPSMVVLAQADDLCGETEPLNVPGTDEERPNWRRRLSCSVDDLARRPLARAILDRIKKERPP
jgi:glycogen operon protein